VAGRPIASAWSRGATRCSRWSCPWCASPSGPGRSMAMLIETAARNHLLRARGRHSALAFAERLDDEIAARQRHRAGESE